VKGCGIKQLKVIRKQYVTDSIELRD